MKRLLLCPSELTNKPSYWVNNRQQTLYRYYGKEKTNFLTDYDLGVHCSKIDIAVHI